MDERITEAIKAALKRGFRVELYMGRDGELVIKTVCRKDLKI